MKTAARSINTRRTQCERSLRRFQAFAWIRQAISPLNTDSPILFFTIPARAKGVAPWDEHVRTVEWCHPEYYVQYGGPWQMKSPTSLSFRLRKQWLESQRAAGNRTSKGQRKTTKQTASHWLHRLVTFSTTALV